MTSRVLTIRTAWNSDVAEPVIAEIPSPSAARAPFSKALRAGAAFRRPPPFQSKFILSRVVPCESGTEVL